jgi:hypothetical protein
VVPTLQPLAEMRILDATGDSAGDFASFDVAPWLWVALIGTIAVLLVVDLLLVHRTEQLVDVGASPPRSAADAGSTSRPSSP